MGELRQRGRIWWIRYYRNGRLPRRERARTTKRGEAERLLRLREGDIAKGVPVSAKIGQLRFRARPRPTCSLTTESTAVESLDYVQRQSQEGLGAMVRGGASDGRHYDVGHSRVCGPAPVGGAANATINRELSALKRMFSLAMQAAKL